MSKKHGVVVVNEGAQPEIVESLVNQLRSNSVEVVVDEGPPQGWDTWSIITLSERDGQALPADSFEKPDFFREFMPNLMQLIQAQGLPFVSFMPAPAKWNPAHTLTICLDPTAEPYRGLLEERSGEVWELPASERVQPIEGMTLQAFEPTPDPSLARIADTLQELLELQPGKQSKTRRELEIAYQATARQQLVINEVYSILSDSLSLKAKEALALLQDFVEVPHMHPELSQPEQVEAAPGIRVFREDYPCA